MLKSLVNLPFRVIGKAARAVQDRNDTRLKEQHGSGQDGDDFDDLANIPDFDTPEDFLVQPPTLDAAAVRAALRGQAGWALIDLRTPSAWRRGALPGAENQPIATLGIRLAELPPADVRIVVYCEDGGELSRAAVRFLRFRGIEDAHMLAGGVAAWRAAGGDLPQP
jgi:rhodanese-related sulfurtransferase